MDRIFNISEESIIYIICPANNKTGGTELLHQLVYQLNELKINACIAYYKEGKCYKDNPTPVEFKKYVNKVCIVDDIIDTDKNVVVFPEVCIGKHRKFKSIQKCVWWLSVDNFNVMLGKINRLKKYGLLSYFKHLWQNDYNSINDLYKIKIHLYQSYFAADFLKQRGVEQSKIYYLSDYINDIYIKEFDKKFKEDIVIYNPKKGYKFTQKLIDTAPEIKWIAIQNMTNAEVRELMRRAKVYIDFGNHPGKDRIPREAAVSGCCVITNKRGSAAYYNDVPISDIYKFDDCEQSIPYVIQAINECLSEYEGKIKDFYDYQKVIMNEKTKFKEDVINIFQ